MQLKDRFLIGVGDTYKTVNGTGGSASHTHNLGDEAGCCIQMDHSGNNVGYFDHRSGPNTHWQANHRYNVSILNPNHDQLGNEDQSNSWALIGSTKSSSNIPPYLAVYMWKRTA